MWQGIDFHCKLSNSTFQGMKSDFLSDPVVAWAKYLRHHLIAMLGYESKNKAKTKYTMFPRAKINKYREVIFK